MIRFRRLSLLLTLAALVAGTIASTPAEAAKRKVPFGFFGTVMSSEMGDAARVTDATLDTQMALMARSGVESLRTILSWPDIETSQGVYNWAGLDRTVTYAARHGIAVLPNVLTVPQWASSRPDATFWWRYAPRDPQLFASFMRQAVDRYGPKGSFWAANPNVPKVPIREWQLFNEQMADFFWATRPWPQSYTKVLKAAYKSIHAADRGATVVAGSLVAVGGVSQWGSMRALYGAGAKRYFDAIAIHPFTNNEGSLAGTIDNMLEIIKRVRAVMRSHGDSRKSIFLTELTWPAAIGKVPTSKLLGLETTPKGQIARLKAAYRALAAQRRKLRVTRAFWFSWATPYNADSPQGDVTYRFAGLTKITGGSFSPMPILRTYTKVARKYEGCRKSDNAKRCR
ncbi:MAG: beta-galactosidase [Thermoleophilaceae bacterium]|nr:beta-galactosidase [Thermoleophilaceae bacterium]